MGPYLGRPQHPDATHHRSKVLKVPVACRSPHKGLPESIQSKSGYGAQGECIPIARNALMLVVEPMWRHPLPDPDDEPFLALADAAMCPLITGNAKHFPPASRGDVTVWSPREFLESRR